MLNCPLHPNHPCSCTLADVARSELIAQIVAGAPLLTLEQADRIKTLVAQAMPPREQALPEAGA